MLDFSMCHHQVIVTVFTIFYASAFFLVVFFAFVPAADDSTDFLGALAFLFNLALIVFFLREFP